MIRGIANQDTNISDLSLTFSHEKLTKLSKKYLFNGSEVSSTDFIGRLNVVLFEAKDLNIVMGGPREWLALEEEAPPVMCTVPVPFLGDF